MRPLNRSPEALPLLLAYFHDSIVGQKRPALKRALTFRVRHRRARCSRAVGELLSDPTLEVTAIDFEYSPGRSLVLPPGAATSEPALERYYELLRARTPLARLATAVDLSSAVRQLAEASIRAADPGASTGVVRARLALRLYGRQVAARLFPGVELDAG
jgi:hypothetical protein